jgi:hypothetical protein
MRKLNAFIFDRTIEMKTLTEIFAEVSKYPQSIGDFGGVVIKHAMFRMVLNPAQPGMINTQLADKKERRRTPDHHHSKANQIIL